MQEKLASTDREVFDMGGNFIAEINKGHELAVTPALYDHFLNVLPPRRLGSDWFVFGEGDDLRIRFTRSSDGCRARMILGALVGGDFYAVVRFDDATQTYRLHDVASWGNEDHGALKSQQFPSIEAIASAMGARL